MEPALGGLIHPEMTGLIGLVFALGLSHGFNPDHLVAIDGMTRSSARVRPGMSRWSGLFFSLGHGAVVTLVGLVVALTAADLRAPRWLEQLGAGISIGVLLVLGIGNLLMIPSATRCCSRSPGPAWPGRCSPPCWASCSPSAWCSP